MLPPLFIPQAFLAQLFAQQKNLVLKNLLIIFLIKYLWTTINLCAGGYLGRKKFAPISFMPAPMRKKAARFLLTPNYDSKVKKVLEILVNMTVKKKIWIWHTNYFFR